MRVDNKKRLASLEMLQQAYNSHIPSFELGSYFSIPGYQILMLDLTFLHKLELRSLPPNKLSVFISPPNHLSVISKFLKLALIELFIIVDFLETNNLRFIVSLLRDFPYYSLRAEFKVLQHIQLLIFAIV